jgi:hypothetical protein
MPSAAEEKRAFLRDLIKLLGIPLVAMVALLTWWHPWVPRTYSAPASDDVFTVASGVWDWTGADSLCVANPHTISFSPDHSVMYIAHRVPWKDSTGLEHRVAEYGIQSHSPSQIRGLIRGETRLTETGVPVVWDLILTSPNSYAWHRTDWPPNGRTKEVARCPAGTDSLVAPP